jgi:hypothetical protein
MKRSMKSTYYTLTAFFVGCCVTIFLMDSKRDDALNTLSDEYCTKVAVSQFSMWVEVRARLRQADNPLTQLNDPERRALDSNPKLKVLSEDIAKLQDIIMTTPIVNGATDLAFKQTYEKLNELIREPEVNKSEIERMKNAFLAALKENAPAFMNACRNHVTSVAGKCREDFGRDLENFKNCAEPKLKENTKLALDLVPGFKVIAAANSTLKNTMDQLVAALGTQ